MKRLIIMGAVVIMTITSCNDFINLTPENEVTYTNGMETPSDMESILANAQATLQGVLTPLHLQELCGTYANGCSDGGSFMPGGVEARGHLWHNTSVDNGFWGGNYTDIGIANIILNNIKPNWSDENKNYFKGQAHFIKGMMYFELARRWGSAPIVPDNDYEAPAIGSSANEEVLNKAIFEALEAFKCLPRFANLNFADGNKVDNKQYANKEIAAALLAHTYAWKAAVQQGISAKEQNECWIASEKYASMLIDGELSGYATLEPSIQALKANTLNSRNGAESIFELSYDTKYTIVMIGEPFYMSNKFFGYPYKQGATLGDEVPFSISCKLVNELYGQTSTDQRRDNFFDVSMYDPDATFEWPDTPVKNERVEVFPGFWMDMTTGGLPRMAVNNAFVKKFDKQFIYTESPTEAPRFYNFDCNKIIWRLADIILLRAEVRNFLGNESGAITDLNAIRSRATAAQYPAVSDTEGLQKAIFREREKELIYENHRFFDIMRNKGYYKTELPANIRILSEQDIIDGALYLPESSAATENNSKLLPNKYWFNRRN